MSYCRWSSDDWRSDIYCYEDVAGGFVTHVAANRIVGDVPRLPELTESNFLEWMEAHAAQAAFIDAAERELIGLPHDGASFHDDELPELLQRLLDLKVMGYNVPAFALELIMEEIEDAE